MRKLISCLGLGILLAGAGILFNGCSQKYPEGLYAELDTAKGAIVLLLEFEKTPLTVVNFVGLAEGTLENTAFASGRPFYDGSRFHRVAPGHVIQGGAPSAEDISGSGYTFPNEINPELSHNKAGVLGMANGGPHTNSSQFYITLGDRSYLDGDYTVFGSVYAGMEVVNSITADDVIESVKIVRIGKKAREFKTDAATFTRLSNQVRNNVAIKDAEKNEKETEFIQSNWPEALSAATGLKYVVLNPGKGSKPQAGDFVKLQYTGRLLNGISFVSSQDKGSPVAGEVAEVFVYHVGTDRINPGLDEAILDMRPGEKRVLIVPAPLGYGTSGFYAQEIAGKRRFVISPGSLLVYELEVVVNRP